MEIEIKGQVALITGASKGLGRYLAKHLSRLGIKVAAIARSGNELLKLKNEIEADGSTVMVCELDISDFEGIGRIS
jgi:short-subunit dehydrogenase